MPTSTHGISNDERYSRQVLFKPLGAEGQRRIEASSVAIVGCGATGSALAMLLSRAGVGRIRIIDRDFVEPSNLQRQNLFDEEDAAQFTPKAIAAQKKIAAFNSSIKVEGVVSDLTPGNTSELLSGFDLLLDATDNFETRYLVNDFAVSSGTPWIYAAAVGAYGVTMNVLPGGTACLSCIFPAQPQGIVETCDTSGILNSAVNMIASIVATEALKLLSGNRDALRKTMLSWDLWRNEHSEINASKPRHDCPTCQQRRFPYLAGEGRPQITLCGRNSVQIHEHRKAVSFAEMRDRLEPHGTVRANDFILKFSREPYEITLFTDGRAIIKGTTDTAVARSLYARYIGS
jgi:molybdopterin/thiamine biosynthesis adenylyltransferase